MSQLYAPSIGDHAYYRNLSGFFQGNYTTLDAHSISRPDKNATRDRGPVNWFTDKTRMEVQLSERPVKNTNVSHLVGSLVLTTRRNHSDTRTAVELEANGIVAHGAGRVYLVGMPRLSPRHLDVRELLAMLPDDTSLQNDTYTMILQDMDERVKRIEDMLARDAALSPPDTQEQTASNCSMHLYGQLLPAGPSTFQTDLDRIEAELAHGTGLVTPRLPPFQLTLVGISDACSLLVQSNTLDGIPMPRFWHTIRWYMCGMMGMLLIQLALMVRMRERANTPSALSKLSGVTFFLQTMYDAHVCLAHLIVGAALEDPLNRGMVGAPTDPVRHCVPRRALVCGVRIPLGGLDFAPEYA